MLLGRFSIQKITHTLQIHIHPLLKYDTNIIADNIRQDKLSGKREREKEKEREKGCKTLTFGLVFGISMSFDWFAAGRWYVVVIEF